MRAKPDVPDEWRESVEGVSAEHLHGGARSLSLGSRRVLLAPLTAQGVSAARRYPLVLVLGLFVVAGLVVAHVAVGPVALSPVEVVAALLGHPAQPYQGIIVVDLRLPRTLIALAAGAMFGLAGAILQAIMRNPLAEPEMTGATSGAVFLAVLAVAQGPGLLGDASYLLPLIAVAGGLGAGAVVYALSRERVGTTPSRLVLTGLLTSAVLRSATSIVLLLHQEAIGGILLWLIGSLNGRVWVHWALLWPWALVLLPLGLASTRWANVLQLGDAHSVGLGVPLGWARGGLLAVAVLLAASSVAVVGGITFLGLIAPHIARRLVGADARRVFPLSMIIGAALLLAADTVAQLVLQPTTLPVGAVLALLGAPFFLYLARRRGR